MDDVDRLFECFKCGISPPQSALRERKRSKSDLKRRSKTPEVSSPGSAENTKKNTSELQLSADKSGPTSVKPNKFNRQKEFSPVVFYGSPHGVPPKKPSRSFLRLLREIRVDLATQKRLTSRKEVWTTFPRQDEAMQFVKGHENVHVFSYQDHYSGQRRFLVSTYNDFWRRYKNMNPKFRHHYEVIQEGLPCHLYFDLEFSRRDNADRNGDEMVDLLISAIFEALLEKYSIIGNKEWILELDSSNEAKFSRHLIIRIEKTAFKDNSHAGAFVTEICSRISSAKERDGRFGNLFIRKDSSSSDSPSKLFVDTAVYTRNRCFRLALSSKAGKNSVLLPTGRFKANKMQCEEEMFMASLICNLDVDCEKLLVCKPDLDCIKTLHFDTEVNRGLGKCYSWPQEYALNGCTSGASATYFLGKSPFPALDAFVESVATIGNVKFGAGIGSQSLHSWSTACQEIDTVSELADSIKAITVNLILIYVADLRRASYYQKCHDPDCRAITFNLHMMATGYRSASRPIPWEIIPDMVYEYKNDPESVLYGDEKMSSSCVTDSWWREVIRVADDVENKQNSLGISNMENIDSDDEDWWMAVERTASQAELAHVLEVDCHLWLYFRAAKFSRHLIIHIEKTAFKDNSHAGAFVTEKSAAFTTIFPFYIPCRNINYCHCVMTYYQICSRISSARERDGRFGNLFIRKDSSSCEYPTLSSRAGKNSVLLPTGRFKANKMQCEEEMFMASLICNLDVDCEKLLVCKPDLDCIKTLHFDTEVNSSLRKCYSLPQEYALNGSTSGASATYFQGKSPFPALDAFVESVATIGNVSGKIRSWYWLSEFALMVYSMSRNRYRERIGRQHKSNRVIYVADLRRAAYYQKCHDPDC
ncbi:unnamed protein product [Malus baccata var. baccata]